MRAQLFILIWKIKKSSFINEQEDATGLKTKCRRCIINMQWIILNHFIKIVLIKSICLLLYLFLGEDRHVSHSCPPSLSPLCSSTPVLLCYVTGHCHRSWHHSSYSNTPFSPQLKELREGLEHLVLGQYQLQINKKTPFSEVTGLRVHVPTVKVLSGSTYNHSRPQHFSIITQEHRQVASVLHPSECVHMPPSR